MEQWAGISAAMKAKGIVPFMDCAYQGFASGDTCCNYPFFCFCFDRRLMI
jgi:aspartate/tyrosine/aromatic aminotransferase